MKIDYDKATPSWEDSHRYGPAPRWRRRMLIHIIKKLHVKTVCDVGCAQPFLMLDMQRIGMDVSGCDISKPVIMKNAKAYPEMKFFWMDLNKTSQSLEGRYELVTCSEVLEHLEDYHTAIHSICRMSSRYVLITVPSGKRYPTDQKMGHFRHYEPSMLLKPLRDNGFHAVKVKKAGFPFFSLYKYLINLDGGKRLSGKFLTSKYGRMERFIAGCVYFLFLFNILPVGNQLIILAERR